MTETSEELTMRNLGIFCAVIAIFVTSCGPTTYEGKKAQQRAKERVVTYSPLSGYSYRLPPREEASESKKEEVKLPPNTRLSYSPITGETTLIELNPGRSYQVDREDPSSREVVASYSPLTGEATWVPRD